MKKKAKKKSRGCKPTGGAHKNQVATKQLEKMAAALVAPVCEAAGIELVLAEFRRESAGRILRLYIDRTGGVTLDDCTHISRQVTDLLDVSLEDIGPYSLEVSSPGINRPLVKPSDYSRFMGHQVRIRLHEPIEGQKKFKGTIAAANTATVQLKTETGTVSFDFSQVARAHLAE